MSANSAHGSALPFERFAAKAGTPPAPAAGLVRILAGKSLMGNGALRGTTAMGSETVNVLRGISGSIMAYLIRSHWLGTKALRKVKFP